MRKYLLLFLLPAVISQSSVAQTTAALTFSRAKMDSLFTAIALKNKGMMSIAITQRGVPLYSKAVGFSEISADKKTPADLQTHYRIGSISKMFTGIMIFQLIEEGKLQLSTPLSDYFPAVTNATKITVANLLSHSSGLYNFTNDTADYKVIMHKKISPAELLARFNKKPDFEPGAKHEYSNTNFVLLGFIVEKLDKRPYEQSLKARITSKIGLNDTYYGGKINPLKNEANSYQWTGSWQPATETDMSIPAGAGALVSTPSDLVKFINALFTGKLISEKSLAEMKTIEGGYGKAMFMIPFYERKGYGHNGGIDGFESQAIYFPDDQVAVAYVANGVNTSMNNMMIGTLSILFNKPYTIPSFNSLAVKTEDLDQYLGIYSTAQLPIKITISKKGALLFGQGTGQPAFPLEATKTNEFTYEAAGVTLIFDATKSEMTFKQGGGTYIMTKEK